MIRRFAILGASGDLTSPYLMPAFAQLFEAGHLPDDLQITGMARDDWDTEAFRKHIGERLDRHAAGLKASTRKNILSLLDYRRADVTSGEELSRALNPLDEPIVAYLALPPSVFAPAVKGVAAAGPPEGSRILIEKPFGEDYQSAVALNDLLHETFPEEAAFRIDHFLGKQTVQNILGLRFANRILEPVWNCQHVERVEIIWDETLALEGRAGYYDSTGALRDMVQNHLLQLLALAAMEAPLRLDERGLRDRKVDVLRAVRRLSAQEIEERTVRGRYTAGRIGEEDVPAYVDEEGVDPDRETETFAQVTLAIDNWRWAGTPFVLRTGKALGRDRREIAVHFKPVPHLAFGIEKDPAPNVLHLEMDPDHIGLKLNINGPGDPFDLEQVELQRDLAPQELTAYARLLLDVLDGDPTLFIRDDEAEESWRIVEPISEAWSEGGVPMREYPAGGAGPT